MLSGEPGKNGTYHVCYTSGLTDDVFRYLTAEQVDEVIEKVRNLEPGTFVPAGWNQ